MFNSISLEEMGKFQFILLLSLREKFIDLLFNLCFAFDLVFISM